MLLCRHHAFQCTDCPLSPFSFIFSPAFACVCLLRFERISFPLASDGRCSLSFSLDLHQTTQSFDLHIFFVHCSCYDFDKLSHTTTVGPSSSPQNLGLLVQPNERTEGLRLSPRLQVVREREKIISRYPAKGKNDNL